MVYLIFLTATITLLISSVLGSDYIKLENFERKIEFAPATFGKVTLGQRYKGELYYDSDLNNEVCSYSNFANSTNMTIPQKKKPFVLMIDRGNCTFVKKAQFAQRFGAFMLVIANTVENQENKDVYMMDNGEGNTVYIETVMITKVDGNFIKDELNKTGNKQLNIEVNFDSNKRDEVYFETVFSSINVEYYDLIKSLREYLVALEAEKFTFYPVYYLETHPSYSLESSQTYKDCFFNGKYCSFPTKEFSKLGIKNGQEVLIENLRQICIFKRRESEKNITMFLDYMQEFNESCMNFNSPNFKSACSKQVLEKIGLKEEAINKIELCISESFKKGVIEDSAENDILAQEKAFQEKVGVRINPSIIVNRKLIMVRIYHII